MIQLIVVVLFFSCVLEAKKYKSHYTFEQFCQDYGRNFPDQKEYETRKNIFEKNLRRVDAHNQDETKTWKLGINEYSDRSHGELKALRGTKVAHRSTKNILPVENYNFTVQDNINIDWRKRGVVTAVKNQGACGSCWSFGSAETLESYYAIATGKLVVLSEQQILDCTPNPNQCGGTGGCGGGTAELAYAQIQKMGGLSLESTYPYVSGGGQDEQCNMNQVRPVAKITGYVNLPTNSLQPILSHLVNNGPLAISVDASAWSFYSGGVFDGCNQKNPDLDHEVMLVGAGHDAGLNMDYWLVRNSWGAGWGENGYIRLARYATPKCGVDLTPGDGDGCAGGPPTIVVCGTCGILYDAVYPVVQK